MLYHVGICCTSGYMLHHVGICCTMLVYGAPCGYMLHHMGICCTTWVYAAPCWYTVHHVGICSTMWVYAASCGQVLHHVDICCIMWVYAVPHGYMLLSSPQMLQLEQVAKQTFLDRGTGQGYRDIELFPSERSSLYSLGWPTTCYIAQAVLKLKVILLPQAHWCWNTTPTLIIFYYLYWITVN